MIAAGFLQHYAIKTNQREPLSTLYGFREVT
jgi:hypothetical protein